MSLTTIINLPVVFLALVIGAAAAPSNVQKYPLVEPGPSHCLFAFSRCAILTHLLLLFK
jgi:hypothetical protein